jgi:hypothetical protein
VNKSQAIEDAILLALRELGRCTARQVECHPVVADACRAAKLKARYRLVMMMHAGLVQSDRAVQSPLYWC